MTVWKYYDLSCNSIIELTFGYRDKEATIKEYLYGCTQHSSVEYLEFNSLSAAINYLKEIYDCYDIKEISYDEMSEKIDSQFL